MEHKPVGLLYASRPLLVSKGEREHLHRLMSEKASLHFAVLVQRSARHIIEWKTRAT
jgi:hypothetical protein